MFLSVFSVFSLFLSGAPLLARADVPELPPIPLDKSTPVQQRLGYHGATGEFNLRAPDPFVTAPVLDSLSASPCRDGRGLEHIPVY